MCDMQSRQRDGDHTNKHLRETFLLSLPFFLRQNLRPPEPLLLPKESQKMSEVGFELTRSGETGALDGSAILTHPDLLQLCWCIRNFCARKLQI